MLGQTISHFKIIEEVGSGGMGVVYKAEDLRLERIVALKFLAPQLTNEPGLRARFFQEAKAAAALSHPNICTVHEVDESGGRCFIAMEFVEGKCLHDKIRERPLPLDEALDLAAQIAQGLQVAHQRAVVHRDIKSANVMVTSDGLAKITDFGLAQLVDSTRITATGARLGTPAYMSPEQAKGEPVDHRTDIWSLGVVLFEMLTGRLPFRGETEQAVTYSILHTPPEHLTSLRAGIPLALEDMVAKALAKKSAERYQHIDDVLVDLKRSLRWLQNNSVEPTKPAAGRLRKATPWILGAACVVFGAVALTLAARAPSSSLGGRFLIPPPPDMAYSGSIAVSPEGRRLAFAAVSHEGNSSLWVRDLYSLDARRLSDTDGAEHPFWSTDGRNLGFFAKGKLQRISADGGPPQVLANVFDARGGAWSRDGVIVFAPNVGDRLYRVHENGGPISPATSLDPGRQETSHQWPRFLDGKRFLYLVWSEQVAARGVFTGSLDAATRTRLLESDWAVTHAGGPSEVLFFVRGRSLLGQPLGSRGLTGSSFSVDPGVWFDGTRPGLTAVSASENGVLAYRNGGARNTQLTWIDRQGKALSTLGPPGSYRDLSISPDEKNVAVSRIDSQTGTYDIWLLDSSRGVSSRFSFDRGEETTPLWSSNGLTITYSSTVDGPANLYQGTATSSGTTHALLRTPVSKYPTDWTDDGKLLIFANWNDKTKWDLWILPAGPGAEPYPFVQSEFDSFQADFSPDGRWVAYTSNESGQYDVYIQSFGDQGVKLRVSPDGGAQPRWRGDGRELFYLAKDRKLMAVEIQGGATLSAGPPRALFQTHVTGLADARNQYYPSRDGTRFLVNNVVQEQAQSSVVVVLNWPLIARP